MKRAKLFLDAFRKGQSPVIPLCKERLGKLIHKLELEEIRFEKQGEPPSQIWINMNKEFTNLAKEIVKAEEGIMIRHMNSEAPFNELRMKLFELKKDIGKENIVLTIERELKKKELTDAGYQRTEPGTERPLPEEIPAD